MKKIPLLSLMALFLISWASGQVQEPPRYIDFDRITIVGHVYNESKRPLPGIRVEIRLAYDAQEEEPEIPGVLEFEHYIWEHLVYTLGTNIFAWAETDDNGYYRISGVPNPGVYFLLVRHADHFLQTWAPVIIHKTGAKEFEADIYLRVRKSDIPEFSKDALEEISLAKKAVADNELYKAIRHFQKAVDMEPEYAEAHYNLGILLRQTGNLPAAVKHLVKAIKHKKHYQIALCALGETLHMQRKYSQSNLYLKKYLEYSESEDEARQKKSQAHYLVGKNCFQLKQTTETILHLSMAIELEPGIHPNAYLLLANSFVIERDDKNAIKNYREFLKRWPDSPNKVEVENILKKLEEMNSQRKKI
ncbi:MAG: tetratricopeptide repeat protein [Candidatus Aminicenantes bacterium]|nr:MAG: tetratricopeptide repeat protein [Candidatus Aminicenantes bacterium]